MPTEAGLTSWTERSYRRDQRDGFVGLADAVVVIEPTVPDVPRCSCGVQYSDADFVIVDHRMVSFFCEGGRAMTRRPKENRFADVRVKGMSAWG